ncbi:helix-turn-helix domain-containing protein [Dongia soli]|uniref:Helix-turn-helix domain-containing protein n=1 Tax=Dongia soli TaxID=600628 RepID=A0ABU5EGQ0_9PROT|nr:helix-turn-helix domain-containing protein [Dongia soli]MDY0885512.1 helix-turn-helix domain-containing protein [Dongia soli]
MAARLTERLKSLGHIASLVNAGSALPEVLSLITTAVCQRSSWSSAAIMAVDEASGYSVLVARYDPLFADRTKGAVDRWLLQTSPVKTVLDARQTMIIDDAQALPDSAGYRQEAMERDYRTVVLLPFSARDEQGRNMVLSVHAHEVRKVDAEETAFLETVALLGSLAVEKAHRLWLEAQQNDSLRQALEIHQHAMERVLTTEDTEAFIELCRRYLDRTLLLVDLTTNQVTSAGDTTGLNWPDRVAPATFRQLAQIVREAEIGQFEQLRRLSLLGYGEIDAIVEPCTAGGDVLGGILLLSDDRALDAVEALTAQELRAAFAMLLLRRRIRFDVQAETHGEFFSRLFSGDWRDEAATFARAHHLQLPLDEPARLAALSLAPATGKGTAKGPAASSADIEQALARLARQRLAGATAFAENATTEAGGTTYIIFLPERGASAKAARQLLEQMIEEIAWLSQAKPVACLSALCQRLEDYRDARRDCDRLLKLAARVGRRGIVESGDFGPLARLIAIADPDALRSFVEETLGAIEDYDRAHDGNLLPTLERFLANSGRYQATADALGIHVTTLRYRLQRLTDVFKLDLEDPDTRIALDVALRVRGTLAG